ncbi:hypothetical protein MSMEG_6034 [Mycolicibacterium smegmatis MC2 155]|jgi:hypothetical protein|uniref:Uncharacterized protein n=1 Tax=Mycolicibacterium smegmatis (strain ATCC 700084 / mc(2)155) TaxID=246196 RepID=A0R520_MYCS2|nr:hypothetical protein MSMEG_6034 [Mycolicibacterium smegmatis MC2 155]
MDDRRHGHGAGGHYGNATEKELVLPANRWGITGGSKGRMVQLDLPEADN